MQKTQWSPTTRAFAGLDYADPDTGEDDSQLLGMAEEFLTADLLDIFQVDLGAGCTGEIPFYDCAYCNAHLLAEGEE